MSVELQDEHRWLGRFVGEWTYEMEAAGPDGEPMRETGTESVRSLGGAWIVAEARADTPDASPALMTLGFDPAKGRVVGTYVGSMMTSLWIYDGELDAAANRLTLDSEGPSFTTEGETAKYRDTMELRGDDQRVMTSSYQGDDGSWTRFMTMTYQRVR